MNLFMNGIEIMRVNTTTNEYYISSGGCLKRVCLGQFIEQLKKISWVCLTSWDLGLTHQYLELVNYVKEVK